MNTANTNVSTAIKTADRPTALRLEEYAKRHNLTPDAAKLVSFLYVNGASNSERILKGTGLAHDKFFAALCVANGVLIMSARAVTVDVCLTSRKAISSIPDSVINPPKPVGPRPSAADPGGELAAPIVINSNIVNNAPTNEG